MPFLYESNLFQAEFSFIRNIFLFFRNVPYTSNDEVWETFPGENSLNVLETLIFLNRISKYLEPNERTFAALNWGTQAFDSIWFVGRRQKFIKH